MQVLVRSPMVLVRKRKHLNSGCFQNFHIRGLSACSQQLHLSESRMYHDPRKIEKVNFRIEAKGK